jgi:hypothetical protein
VCLKAKGVAVSYLSNARSVRVTVLTPATTRGRYIQHPPKLSKVIVRCKLFGKDASDRVAFDPIQEFLHRQVLLDAALSGQCDLNLE